MDPLDQVKVPLGDLPMVLAGVLAILVASRHIEFHYLSDNDNCFSERACANSAMYNRL